MIHKNISFNIKISCRNFLNFVTEEIKDPHKTLPRAIYISLPVVTFVYVMSNAVYFSKMDVNEILSTPATAVVSPIVGNSDNSFSLVCE